MSSRRRDRKGRVLRPNERQRADGKYEFRYTDANGAKHSVYSWKLVPTDSVPAGKRCNCSLRDIEKQLQENTFNGLDPYKAQSLTVDYYFNLFIETKVGIGRKTIDDYTRCYQSYAREKIGGVKISNIKKSDILKLYLNLANERLVGFSSIEKTQYALTQVFDLAVSDRTIQVNPCSKALNELKRGLRYKRGRKNALSRAQQEAFVRYFNSEPRYRWWAPFLTFMLGTGCRVGEALGMTWDDIDFVDGIIHVRRSLMYYKNSKNEYEYSVHLPKTAAGVREIPMLDVVRKALLEEKEKSIDSDVSIDGVSGFIWRTKEGSLPIPGTINAMLYAIQRTYNEQEIAQAEAEKREPLLLPKFSSHVLRHTFCTRLCENETNLKLIQDVMGHSNISTTMDIYNEVTKEFKKNSFKNLNGKIVA